MKNLVSINTAELDEIIKKLSRILELKREIKKLDRPEIEYSLDGNTVNFQLK